MFTQLYQLFSIPTRLHHIGNITSRTFKAVTNSNAEHVEGWKLGTDSWADICCASKNAVVEEFVEGQTVTATGFTSYLGSVSNISIANFVYAYDSPDGTVLLLEFNYLIYLGQKMSDSLLNPIQEE